MRARRRRARSRERQRRARRCATASSRLDGSGAASRTICVRHQLPSASRSGSWATRPAASRSSSQRCTLRGARERTAPARAPRHRPPPHHRRQPDDELRDRRRVPRRPPGVTQTEQVALDRVRARLEPVVARGRAAAGTTGPAEQRAHDEAARFGRQRLDRRPVPICSLRPLQHPLLAGFECAPLRAQQRQKPLHRDRIRGPAQRPLPVEMRELYVAFNRLRTKLRRSGHLREYFAVVETTQAGALHLHVLATGRYLPQRELSKAAAAAGFGRVADIRAVTGTGDGSAGAYLVKTLAGYATKANAARLATRGARRLRPVRTSRAWYPGGMAEAEREVGRRMAAELSLAPDPGPWLFVVKGGDGALHVRSQAAPLVLLTTGAGVAQPSGGAATAPGGRGRAACAGRRPARGPGASGARP